MTKLTYTRDGIEYATEVESLPPASLAYLLQYGWAQSHQDSIAGRAKVVRDEGGTEADVAADIAGTLAKRRDSILAGTMGLRTGGAESVLPGCSPMYVRVAKEWLAAFAKAKGLKLPKADSDEYRALLRKYSTAKADAITAEATRREAATADIDLDI